MKRVQLESNINQAKNEQKYFAFVVWMENQNEEKLNKQSKQTNMQHILIQMNKIIIQTKI